MIKPTFDMNAIRKALRQEFRDKLQRTYIQVLQNVGEKAIIYARSLNTYKDQSHNLRSSVGYVIYHDGKLIDKNFEAIKGGTEGAREGEKFANSIVRGSKGFALVVVAGMDYAYLVQARGYDVLDGAEQLAEREMPRMLNEVKGKIDQWAGSK